MSEAPLDSPPVGPSLGRRDAVDLGGVVLMFLAAAGILNSTVGAPPLVDEPIFATSAFQWAADGQLEISGLSAPIGLLEVIWGGLFIRLLGPSYEALRWSTIALTAISAPFFYWMLAQLSANRTFRSTGVVAYLFCPLVFVLSGTFMTDMHTAALTAIAASLFVRGLVSGIDTKWLVAGSVASSIGFLSRPQALVPTIAMLLVLLISVRPLMDAAKAAVVVAIPAIATLVTYAIWASSTVEPFIRSVSRDELASRHPGELTSYVAMAVISGIVYIGLVVLPLAPGFFPSRAGTGSPGYLWVLILLIILVGVASVWFGLDPTEGQGWVTVTGFAGVDRGHLGERPALWPSGIQIAVLVSAVTATALLARGVVARWPKELRLVRLFLVLIVGGTFAAACLASVTHSRILDRYWAPVVPIVVALAIGVAIPSAARAWLAGVGVGLVGVFSIVGTYDGMVAQREIVAFAEEVTSTRVAPDRFDGGASWSALKFGVADDDGPQHVLERLGPYWVKFYAVDTNPTHGLALEPLVGYEVLDRRELPSILHIAPVYVYLVRRDAGNYFVRATDF